MPENCTVTETEKQQAVEKAYEEEYSKGSVSEIPIKPPKKSTKNTLAFARLVTAFSVVGLVALGLGFLKTNSDKKKLDAQLSAVRSEYDSAVSEYENTIATMERTYVYDNGVSKTDVEIYENIPKNPYDNGRFLTDGEGKKYYTDETGAYVSSFGIDVSYHQGDIYWENVAADGVEFAIIRAGYRGYQTGELMQDERFTEYIQGAQNAGIDVGIYFFSQAINEQEALEEAEFVLSMIEGYDVDYPVVFDWEYISTDEARTDDLQRDVLTKAAVTFCERIKEAGYTPMIYGNAATLIFRYDLADIADYDFWLAQYYDTPSFYYDFKMWQYSSSGIVDGISNYVDMNVCFKKYSD